MRNGEGVRVKVGTKKFPSIKAAIDHTAADMGIKRVNYMLMYQRLRAGMTVKAALKMPIREYRKHDYDHIRA
jgi:hypothetical protein